MLRTERPSVLGPVAGEASAPVGSEILEKGVLCCNRRTQRLKGSDSPGRVRVDFQLGNDRRCGLRVSANIREQPAKANDSIKPALAVEVSIEILPSSQSATVRGATRMHRHQR